MVRQDTILAKHRTPPSQRPLLDCRGAFAVVFVAFTFMMLSMLSVLLKELLLALLLLSH